MDVRDIHKKLLVRDGYTDLLDWTRKEHNLYIGRNMSFYVPGAIKSKWSNPFTAKKYGLASCLEKYEEYIRSSELYDQLEELEGMMLGCWCVETKSVGLKELKQSDELVGLGGLGECCHGQVLCRLLKQKTRILKYE